jgi:uncharacterized membrane protein
MRERHRRSVAKGISWRIFATADTIFLALIFTGSVGAALSIGGLELITKTLWYYFHERVWIYATPSPESRFHRHFGRNAHARSLIKAATWRAIGALDTFIISLVVTGHLLISTSIGGTELVTKVGLYYLHERLWLHIRWGRIEESAQHDMKTFAGRFRAARAVLEEHFHMGAAILYGILCALFVLASASVIYLLHTAL